MRVNLYILSLWGVNDCILIHTVRTRLSKFHDNTAHTHTDRRRRLSHDGRAIINAIATADAGGAGQTLLVRTANGHLHSVAEQQ